MRRTIDNVAFPLKPRIAALLDSEKDLETLLKDLRALGIDPSPERNEFIRYYPPLREMPFVQKPGKIDLSGVRGELSLFLYIPFCTGRCTYCFYPKLIDAPEKTVNRYIETLRKEIALFRPTMSREVSSIYVGGGTPSCLSVAQLESLLGDLDMPGIPGVSMTVEVSPETVTAEKIAVLRRLGTTRISMGVQSLDDAILRRMGRRYDAAEAKEKVRLLADGIESFNLDFIYGLEGQGIEDVERMIRFVREVQPPSVTFYQRWTALRDTFLPPKRNAIAGSMRDILGMRALIEGVMIHNGYEQDSLFRYVKKREDGCAYCRNVWADNSCVAAGMSAYGYIDGNAYQNTARLTEYTDAVDAGFSPVRRMKRLLLEEQATRALVLGLKTAGASCSLDVRAIERKYSASCSPETADLLDALDRLGVMEFREGSIRFTGSGIAFAEQILGVLMERVRFLRIGKE